MLSTTARSRCPSAPQIASTRSVDSRVLTSWAKSFRRVLSARSAGACSGSRSPSARASLTRCSNPTRRLPDNGPEAWNEVLRGNYEGMVAKDPESAYTPGRTLSWLKVRQKGDRQGARGFNQG